MQVDGAALEAIYDSLAKAHGAQGWWPGDSPFEIMVGAVLTQRTAWRNVELAIARLRASGLLDWRAIRTVPTPDLEQHVRPAGFYRQKAARLKGLADWLAGCGGVDGADTLDDDALRASLLALHGIGPETADAIVLYAFRRPRFVVDAYARRILGRCGLITGSEPYAALQRALEDALTADADRFGEWHALIVAHGKSHCRPRPDCPSCTLAGRCRTGRERTPAGR